MTQMFALQRVYEPHGPLVRSQKGGQLRQESGLGMGGVQFPILLMAPFTSHQVNSEYYTGWLDYWGQNHSTRSVRAVTKGLENMLKLGASVNM